MLTREQIEKIRKELVSCAYVPQDAVILNALCDLALSALAPTSSSGLVERLRERATAIRRAGVNRASDREAELFDKAADALSVREGWAPIETAPRDGTAILVMRDIWPGTKSGRAEQCNGYNTYVAEWWAGEHDDGGAWMCYMDMIQNPECPIIPTHWMPLPEPPPPVEPQDITRSSEQTAVSPAGQRGKE